MLKIPDYYGEVKLYKLTESGDFWALIDELCGVEDPFLNNRNIILDAFKDGRLLSLKVKQTQEMYDRDSIFDNIFMENTIYVISCFLITNEDNKVEIIWVHPKNRKLGIGRKLIEMAGCKSLSTEKLKGSEEFWKSMNM